MHPSISKCNAKKCNCCKHFCTSSIVTSFANGRKFSVVNNWAAPSEFVTYRLCEQRRFRRACASAQSRQNLRCSLIQTVSQEEPSDRKPDSWPLWKAGHAQSNFVMTECSKTQIRLTGLNYDLDWKSIDLIYDLTWNTTNCKMQYVRQTGRALRKRFGEHYRRVKKPKQIDTFLYQHLKLTCHSPNDDLVQPVTNLWWKYSSSRFRIIKSHQSELKWIKLLYTFSTGFNDNIHCAGNISKMPDFDVISLLEIRKRKSRSHGLRKRENDKF